MRDYRFHCEDCDSYSQCRYYHNRKGTSLICKEFQHGSSIIEQIRAAITFQRYTLERGEEVLYRGGYNDGIDTALDIIDHYTK